jgi:tetratricopeptide (TPR) repeat protein
MARAAVKAKQQARLQTAKPSRPRGRRRHSGGGNPNQQLFFVRLRRGQKWLYGLLAAVFMLTFVAVGVGSGAQGLGQLWSGIFGGGGGTSVSKAQDEIKTNPARGYRDLATAYESKGQNVLAMAALQNYLGVKKKDANEWAQLGGLEETQAQKYARQYSSAQQAAQLADPSAPFAPAGTLGAALGTNAAYQTAAQQASARESSAFQKAEAALQAGLKDDRQVTKLRPKDPTAWEQLATAATNAGNFPLAIHALRRYLRVYPSSPLRSQVEAQIKQLQQALAQAQSNAKK